MALSANRIGWGQYGGNGQAPGRQSVGPTPQFSGMRGLGGSPVPASAAFGSAPNVAGKGFSSRFSAHRTNLNPSIIASARNNSMGQAQGGGTNVNAVQAARAQGPDMAAIKAEMQRRQGGASMGAGNAALAGYMMGK